ncbi:prepilin peptidase [Metabacillus arenae]|uniref:Prepilin leader peptidase/N-methyltransferase n=1 Tax=Metabacillus arenae TaxID=2771434 RepID=A0A926NI38_9BACI|nr:A24 family peptidase [Metabacillus arenae]MBD1381195.1 prepilin peptidase [Metabacillus arenae]
MSYFLGYCLLAILGLLLGSFYNVVGLRVPANKSIIAPRSSCPCCGHMLTSMELIPIFSYLFQKGKCKKCNMPISPLYPIMELLTSLLFTISPVLIGWTAELLVALTFISLFIILFITDLTYMIIPDKVLLFFFCFFIIEHLFIPFVSWSDSLIGAIVGFGLLLSIAYLSKGGMGGGDIKLFALLGFVLGWKLVLLTLFLASLLGATAGGIGLLAGYINRKKPIPFAPFIMTGALAAYFFGDEMIRWYLQISFNI